MIGKERGGTASRTGRETFACVGLLLLRRVPGEWRTRKRLVPARPTEGGRSVQFRTSISTCTRFRIVRRGADCRRWFQHGSRSVGPPAAPPVSVFAPPRSTIRPFFVFFRCSSGQTPRCGAVMEGCKWPQHVLHSWLLYLHMQCSAALSSSFQPGLCTGGTCREGESSQVVVLGSSPRCTVSASCVRDDLVVLDGTCLCYPSLKKK
jgi:hypothetical protein